MITIDTPLSQLPFLSSHNSILIDAQLCGTLGFSIIEKMMSNLGKMPVCIEIDISVFSKKTFSVKKTGSALASESTKSSKGLLKRSKKSKKQLNIYVDHYSKNLNKFSLKGDSSVNEGVISREDNAYQKFNEGYHQAVSKEYSITRVLKKIAELYEEVKSKYKQFIYPLLITIDISKTKKMSHDLRDEIFRSIETDFKSSFSEYILKTELSQFQKLIKVNEMKLKYLMNKVLLRINNSFGDIKKPPYASEKIKILTHSDKQDKFFKIPENSSETGSFTRIYPDLVGTASKKSMKTLKDAIKLKARKSSKKVKSFGAQIQSANQNIETTKRISETLKGVTKRQSLTRPGLKKKHSSIKRNLSQASQNSLKSMSIQSRISVAPSLNSFVEEEDNENLNQLNQKKLGKRSVSESSRSSRSSKASSSTRTSGSTTASSSTRASSASFGFVRNSVLRSDCKGEPDNYRLISNFIVKQFILNSEMRLINVNSIAVNIHDLVPEVYMLMLKYYENLYKSAGKQMLKFLKLSEYSNQSVNIDLIPDATNASANIVNQPRSKLLKLKKRKASSASNGSPTVTVKNSNTVTTTSKLKHQSRSNARTISAKGEDPTIQSSRQATSPRHVSVASKRSRKKLKNKNRNNNKNKDKNKQSLKKSKKY